MLFRLSFLYWLTMIVVIIGAINLGILGLFHIDVVAYLFGPMTSVTRAVYIAVGVSAIIVTLISINELSSR